MARHRSKLNAIRKETAALKAEAARVTAYQPGGDGDLFDRIDSLTLGYVRGEIPRPELPPAVTQGIEAHAERVERYGPCQHEIDTQVRLRALAPDLFPADGDEATDG